MNLYLISQDTNNDYDTYDSAVVAAESEDIAQTIHPGNKAWAAMPDWTDAENVSVELIGIAKEGTEQGVICASFNAG